MVPRTLLAVILAALVAPVQAAPALSFEQSAAAVRSQIHAARAREFSPLSAQPASGKAAAGRPKKKGIRSIRLSGSLSLDGTGHAGNGSPWVTVTLSGWTTLRDDNGGTLRGSIRFSDTQTFHASGNHLSGWARPYAYVDVYENGKHLGTARVDGSIYVSGWNNGGWVRLSGTGQVYGTLVVQD